jgi:hypothetical protein
MFAQIVIYPQELSKVNGLIQSVEIRQSGAGIKPKEETFAQIVKRQVEEIPPAQLLRIGTDSFRTLTALLLTF